MRCRLLALIVGMLLIGAIPATASASSFGEQSAGQDAASQQSATSGATSTQIAPSNENISVRVLSPGDNGNVSQSNNSSAKSGALNANLTGQGTSQVQSGGGAAAKALQTAAQEAGNMQSAESHANSTQDHPSNENISVRVLSPGNDGNVDQSNNSDAASFAGNANGLLQKTEQGQGGSGKVITPASRGTTDGKGDCGCDSGSKGIQAAGQDAWNRQNAKSDATSKQIKPENQNDSARVLSGAKPDLCGCDSVPKDTKGSVLDGKGSPCGCDSVPKTDTGSGGDNGSVTQSNNSDAKSFAGNLNFTKQDVTELQAGMPVVLSNLVSLRDPCGCQSGGNTGVQAGGQDAWNGQNAMSNANSEQLGASNDNSPIRLKHSDGSNGDVSQENNSSAHSKALNVNKLLQVLQQLQDTSGGGGLSFQQA
jgi:hypothetical protein